MNHEQMVMQETLFLLTRPRKRPVLGMNRTRRKWAQVGKGVGAAA